MRSRTVVLCAVVAMMLPASVALAQDAPKPDTLPFHKSQWAAQFVAGTQFFSAGVLHFRSPKSAWLLDGSFYYSYNKAQVDGDPSLTDTQNSGSVRLRVGQRNFKPLGNSTQFFTTFGGVVLAGGAKDRGSLAGNNWSWGAGVFGELGANYMLTSHIGFGAAAGLQVTYNQSGYDATSVSSSAKGVSISGALLSLQIGIYF
jgi:hypothetical protein